MKKTFTILIAAIAAILMMAQPGNVWATDITVNMTGYANGSGNSYVTSNTESSISNVTFVACNYIPNNGQVRGGKTTIGTGSNANFHIYNTSEMPGAITQIVISCSADNSNYFKNNLYAATGTSSQASVNSITGLAAGTRAQDGSSFTWTFDAEDGITYFKLCSTEKFTNGNVSGCSIKITYTSSGGGGSTTYTLSSAVTPTGAGSVSLDKTSLEEDETATATATANAHFSFTSWSIAGEGATLSSPTTNPTTVTMGTANATVTATFTEDPKYNITYNANYTGATDEPVVVSEYADESVTIAPYSTFTRAGYAITSWNTAADGNGTPYSAGDSYTMTSAGLTLYAQWTAGATGTIVFSNSAVEINAASVTGDDNLGNEWTITTVGTSSFTSNAAYYQVGSSSKPATSITFTTTLPSSSVINSFSAKFGGFSGTGGTITLKVGDASVGTGSLNETSDVVVTNTSSTSGTVLTVTVTSISKGVKCYYISYSYATGSDPIISDAPNSITLGSLATSGEIPYSITNPVSGRSLTATTTADWISNITVASDKVTFTTSVNTSTTEDRTATITLQYEGATDKVVTVTQNKVDYAKLPFEYDGNGIYQVPNCFETNLTASYTYSPKMKFDATGKYLTLHLNESPTSLSYDIIGNGGQSSWAGTFRVETSADGNTWSTLVTYTTLAATTQSFTHVDLATEVRYIRWYYETKSNGNVGLGNIHATAEYDIYGTCTVASLAPTSSKKCTIYNGGVLTVTGTLENGTAANLIIEDGGQLISNSVAATVHKTIDAWANNSGWYLLSSPIQDATITSISNLITTESGYDLFRYNESKSTNQWENYKNEAYASDFTSFERGRGYLYRNAATQDVTFTGSTNTSVTYNLSYANAAGDLKGFNIIGNPFTHNITWTDITKSSVNPNGYYTLGTDGNWTIHKLSGDLNTNTIAPMQGFLVQANGGSPYVTFGAAGKNNETKANNDYIKFMVNNGQYNDVTYALFDKGDGINKIDHRNAEIPMLYISQDGKNYAIATMGDDTQMFDLSFEAKTMGTYTISMNAKGNFSYIHLIDRLTGDDTNLLIEDYSFIGSPQDNAERFIVKLSYDNGSSTGSETFAYQSGNEIIVNGEGTLEVYDVTGRKVMTTTINGVETINGLNSGVYIFRVIGETLKTQKIVVR